MEAIRRPGTKFVCEMTPDAEVIWNRLKNAARRGDRRLAKKALASLQRLSVGALRA